MYWISNLLKLGWSLLWYPHEWLTLHKEFPNHRRFIDAQEVEETKPIKTRTMWSKP